MRRDLLVAVLAFTAAALMPLSAADEASLGGDWIRGLNFTSYTGDGYARPGARGALQAARRTGATHIALVPVWYQAKATDDAPRPEPGKSPDDAAVEKAARDARALGFELIVKPHVDVLDGTFRGELAPNDRQRWFSTYEAMILRYAQLAAKHTADVFVVGTELTSLARAADAPRWRALIKKVRGVFAGRLTFAANWIDGARRISFWDELDLIGIDAYMPLTRRPADDIAALQRAWRPHVRAAQRLHEREDKPLFFTELGYQNRAGSSVRPHDAGGARSDRAQARLYEAAFRAFAGRPWFHGIVWWDWSAEGRDADLSLLQFSPRGREAARVLGAWHAR